jgi:hypothetical protein
VNGNQLRGTMNGTSTLKTDYFHFFGTKVQGTVTPQGEINGTLTWGAGMGVGSIGYGGDGSFRGKVQGYAASGRWEAKTSKDPRSKFTDDGTWQVQVESGPGGLTKMPPEPVTTRFTKAKDGVINDRDTGLQWYVGPDRSTPWNEAKAWSESLTVAGGGWRMPTIAALKALYQKGASPNNLDPVFQITSPRVWPGQMTGKLSPKGAPFAWAFLFDYGKESDLLVSDSLKAQRAFAVRARR